MRERPPSALPVERVRGERPASADWRADGAARSHHGRLLDRLVEPLADHDPDRAAEICAEICRAALLDRAPALLLLPAAERRRARVLAAFVLTLFDLAAKPGLDGDRLAEINRWEFRLEEALDGRPAGQPIFVLLAREEARRPWRRQGLDRILAAARRRALRAGSGDAAAPAADSGLAQGLVEALLGAPPGDQATRLAHRLLSGGGGASAARPARPRALPPSWRPAARYLVLVGDRLGAAELGSTARLGLGGRLWLLARARLAL